jgi:hypothetical protein
VGRVQQKIHSTVRIRRVQAQDDIFTNP